MDSILKDLPWEGQAIIYLLTVLVVALGLLAIPVKWLQWLGTRKYPWFAANAISFYRVPVTLAGAYIYYSGISFYWGVVIMAAGLILDRLDGKMAAVLDELHDPRYPGKTPYGKVIDPMADKLCLVPMLWFEALSGFVPLVPVVVMTGFEVIGTVVRPPFINRKWRARWYRWMVVKLRRRLRDPKATGFGKGKMFMQCVLPMLITPYRLEWWDGGHGWLTHVMWSVTVLAGLSVVFRFKYHKYVDSVITPLDEFFAHTNGKKIPVNGKGNGKV